MPSASGIRLGTAFVEVRMRDRISQGLTKAQRRLSNFARTTRQLGAQLLVGGGAAFTPFGLSLATFAKLEDQLLSLRGITGANADEFERLSDQAKKLGASTSFSATDVAGGQVELGRAGFNADEIENTIPAVLALSRATGTDLAEAAGIVAATLRQFGLEASEAGRVSDLLTATANGSFNSVTTLGDSLGYAGSVAADLNIPLEDTLAMLGVLGNMNIQGSAAGTALRRLALISAGDAQRLEAIFNLSLRDQAGEVLPLLDVLEKINGATAEMGTGERAKKMKQAFGLLGITGASALGKSAGSVKELRQSLDDADGMAQRLAADMDSGVGGSFRRALSVLEGIQNAVGEAIGPTFSGLIDLLGLAGGDLIEFVGNNQELVTALAMTAAGLVGVGGTLLAIAATASVAAFAWSGLMTVWGFLLSAAPILAGVLGLFVLPSAPDLDGLMAAFGGFFDFVSADGPRAWSAIVDRVQSGDLAGAFELIKASLMLGWTELTTHFSDQWSEAIDFWGGLFDGFVSLLSDFWSGLALSFDSTISLMSHAWTAFVDLIGLDDGSDGVFTSWNDVTFSIMTAWENLYARLAVIMEAISQLAKATASSLREELLGALDAFMGPAQAVVGAIPGMSDLQGEDSVALRDRQASVSNGQRYRDHRRRLDEIETERAAAVAALEDRSENQHHLDDQRRQAARSEAQQNRADARAAFEAAINAGTPTPTPEQPANQPTAATATDDDFFAKDQKFEKLFDSLDKARGLAADGSIGAELDIAALATRAGVSEEVLKNFQGRSRSVGQRIEDSQTATTSGGFTSFGAQAFGSTSKFDEMVSQGEETNEKLGSILDLMEEDQE